MGGGEVSLTGVSPHCKLTSLDLLRAGATGVDSVLSVLIEELALSGPRLISTLRCTESWSNLRL